MTTPDPTRAAMQMALEALEGAVAWDKSRNFIVPYKVRDPIHAAIAALRASLALPAEDGRTGLDPEIGWIMEAATKGELAAYDAGCAGMMAALQHILDGEDTGAGVANEPWESLRLRVLRLVALPAEGAEPPAPAGWWTEELERIWTATPGSRITADMKRAAAIALRVARGERWDDAKQEWFAATPHPPQGRGAAGDALVEAPAYTWPPKDDTRAAGTDGGSGNG